MTLTNYMTQTALVKQLNSDIAYAVTTGDTSRRNNQKEKAELISKHDVTAYDYNGTILYFTEDRHVLMQQSEVFKLGKVDAGTARGFIMSQKAKGIEYPVKLCGNKLLHGADMVADILERYNPEMIKNIKIFGINEILAKKCGVPDKDQLVVKERMLPRNYKEALLELAEAQTVSDNIEYFYCDKPIANSFLVSAIEGKGDNRIHGFITTRELLDQHGYNLEKRSVTRIGQVLKNLCLEYNLPVKKNQGYTTSNNRNKRYSQGYSTAIVQHFPAVIKQMQDSNLI